MSDSPLHKHLPQQVDPRKFAQKGVALSGPIAMAELPRLQAAVAGAAGEVVVDLTFGVDEQGCKVVQGRAEVQVSVICQRCLEPMALKLTADIALGVVWNEDQANSLPRHLDPWILGEGAADLYQAVEEELLLALPMVAYHEQACVEASAMQSGEPPEAPAESNNPFKVLEQLKGSPK